MRIASRISKLHPSGIRAVMALADKRQESGLPVIHMEVGQPDFATPDHITEAALKAARDGFTGYTPNAGVFSLRNCVAKRVEIRTQTSLTSENICITSGGVMALYLVFMAIVEPGDEVLVPDPGFPNYLSAITMSGGIVVPYLLDQNFELDIDILKEKITPKTRSIIINFPGNPTGATISSEKMSALIKLADEYNLQIISDEIYEDFVFEGEHISALSSNLLNRVILISGVSKTYSMTGWRIGWIVANEKIIQAVSQLVEPITSCPSSVSQAAAEAAIRGPQDCVTNMRAAYKRRAELAVSILEPSGLLASKPQGAFYAMVDISKSGLNSNEFVRNLLDETGVATAPGETFGFSARSFIRLSTAISDDDVVKGCTLLRDYLNS